MSQSSDEKSKHTIQTSLTLFNGRCYTIRLADDFLNDGILKIRLNSSTKLVAFAHEPGYEIWSHLGIYPVKPKMVSLGNNEDGLSDFIITKSVHQKAKYCDLPDIIDCTANYLEVHFEEFINHISEDKIPMLKLILE